MNILLPQIHKVNFDLWNYGYIWPRDQIINGEKQDYVTPQDNPIQFKQIVHNNSISPIIAPPALRAKYGQMYSSAAMTTHGKLAFMYGTLEVRFKLPKARGLWPAIWLLGEYDAWPSPWPMLPEFDIMEYIGGTILHSTCHYYKDGEIKMSRSPKTEGKTEIDPNVEHVAVFNWDKSTMSVTVDGMASLVIPTPANFINRHAHLLVNVAVGGGWPEGAGYVPVQSEMSNQTLTRFEVKSIELKTDNLKYDLPESCKITGVSGIPKVEKTDPVTERNKKAEQDRITGELLRPGEVDARMPNPRVATSTPTQPGSPPVTTAINENLQKLMSDLMMHGWYQAHNKEFSQEILHKYLTGQKTSPNLDSPTFIPNDANYQLAWGGVLDILNKANRAMSSPNTELKINADEREDTTAIQAKLDAATREIARLLNHQELLTAKIRELNGLAPGA